MASASLRLARKPESCIVRDWSVLARAWVAAPSRALRALGLRPVRAFRQSGPLTPVSAPGCAGRKGSSQRPAAVGWKKPPPALPPPPLGAPHAQASPGRFNPQRRRCMSGDRHRRWWRRCPCGRSPVCAPDSPCPCCAGLLTPCLLLFMRCSRFCFIWLPRVDPSSTREAFLRPMRRSRPAPS
jgi:hypothetical protein